MKAYYNWKNEHARLWNELVPPRGQADTLQGELVRMVGKLVDQAYRNGNANWDHEHELMWRFIADKITENNVFNENETASINKTVEIIIRDEACPDLSGNGSTYYLINERVVDWCLAHPEPIPHQKITDLIR